MDPTPPRTPPIHFNDNGLLSVVGGPAITVSGPITVNSGSTITLAGSGGVNTPGDVLLYGGALYQNSSGTFTPTRISSKGGTLGGTGTIATNLSLDLGSISPGSAGVGSIGTLTVQGSVTIPASGGLDIDFLGTSHDLLAMTGTNRTLNFQGKLNICGSATPVRTRLLPAPPVCAGATSRSMPPPRVRPHGCVR